MVVDTSTAAAALAGFVLPAVVAYLSGRYATSRYKTLLMLGACFVTALLTAVLGEGVPAGDTGTPLATARTLLVNFVAVLVTTGTLYARVYRPLGATRTLQAAGPQWGGRTLSHTELGDAISAPEEPTRGRGRETP